MKAHTISAYCTLVFFHDADVNIEINLNDANTVSLFNHRKFIVPIEIVDYVKRPKDMQRLLFAGESYLAEM